MCYIHIKSRNTFILLLLLATFLKSSQSTNTLPRSADSDIESSAEISNHIRKCCISGIRHARNLNNCENYDHEVQMSIAPLWRGLCFSTYSVCCTREIEQQQCIIGRQAALLGTRCDEPNNTTVYADCCRACQVGLAVKASNNQCEDTLFSYFYNIESFRICCSTNFSTTDKEESIDATTSGSVIFQSILKGEAEIDDVNDVAAAEDTDITEGVAIVLPENDDDICSKVPNLCQQICENTDEAYRCKCYPEYKLDENNVTCTMIAKNITSNIDECLMKSSCELGYHCVNIAESYECVKEDLKKTSNSESSILNVSKCNEGFQFKHGHCVDIDECILDKKACDNTQICTNDIGGYHCDCKIGFNLDTTTNACVDINECSINNHNCLPTQRCDNTVGSYICTRLQSCGTGYTLNAETGNCVDDDECTVGTHNCPSDYECYNTKGSFRCYRRSISTTSSTTTTKAAIFNKSVPNTPAFNSTKTVEPSWINHFMSGVPYKFEKNRSIDYVSHQTHSRQNLNMNYESPRPINNDMYTDLNTWNKRQPLCNSGFERNYLGACVDVNECLQQMVCESHQRCINTNGSYRCQNLLQCSAGYKSTTDGSHCVDIDECENGEHNCADNQICRNRQGSYICSCSPGHKLQNMSTTNYKRCVDINECEQDGPLVCPSNAQCVNTIGSYYCECKSGFQKSSTNDRICLDVDECQEIPGLCQQKCVNFWGGYRCSCYNGYELSSDNRTCNDIDECEVHKLYKLCMGFCINVPGSYECSCPRGYTLGMDRNTCRDIDECATGEVCTGRHDICTNIRGSYKCTTINCPYGYINDPDQKNRCRQTNTQCDGDCYNKPSAYTYNFITLVSKLGVPPEGRTIFSLHGPLWYDDIDFDLKIIKIQAAANIEKASDNHFSSNKGNHEMNLVLTRSLEGPQDIELEISMTVFINGIPHGKSVAKIFILVSQYTF